MVDRDNPTLQLIDDFNIVSGQENGRAVFVDLLE